MVNRSAWCVIPLNQGEGRTWHVQVGLADERSKKCAGKFGLSCAELAFEQNHIAWPNQLCNPGGEGLALSKATRLDHQANLPHGWSREQSPYAPEHLQIGLPSATSGA